MATSSALLAAAGLDMATVTEPFIADDRAVAGPAFGSLPVADPPLDGPSPALVDSESVAWVASLVVHVVLMVALAAASLALPAREADLGLAFEPLDLPEEVEIAEEFASADDEYDALGALSAGGMDSALASAPQLSLESLVSIDEPLTPVVAEAAPLDLMRNALEAPEKFDAPLAQGVGSVGATGAEGAIDRITHEILASLQQRPTLVVWMFDQSGSMRTEREAVLKRFRRIYDELGVIEAAENPAFRRHKDKPLLTAVVGFDAEPRALTPEPTDDFAAIELAIKSMRDADTQVENVFTAVAMAAEKYRRYRSASQGGRNVMIVVFTDESGDDAAALDEAVDLCRKSAIPVYVVGRPAPFGRQFARVKWVDPDPRYDQRPQWPPVRLGPESLLPERLKLSFADGRDRGEIEELLDSGFGPYALTRLCFETGGIYFTVHPNRTLGRSIGPGEIDTLAVHFARFFDPDVMVRYQPEYVSVAQYERLIGSNRARRALVEAAALTWTATMENVRLRFPKRDEAELAQALTTAQRTAAVLQPKIDRVVQILATGAEDRDRLAEPRWQAGYDLAMGRALAVQVRTAGYNAMLAQAKQGMPFKSERNNTWILRPGSDFPNSALEKTAQRSREYLDRVVAEHPGTPWHYLAQRELAVPLGWQWTEGYTPLPRQNPPNNNRPPRPQQDRPIPEGPPRRDPPPL
ncbi:MAG: VWA domain-containing protein [Pirellulales bacterium]|nr:VWA domain-containing protein [Pirellulales bacterium]